MNRAEGQDGTNMIVHEGTDVESTEATAQRMALRMSWVDARGLTVLMPCHRMAYEV